MDCRRFRAQHAQFADDTLPGVEMDAMRAHRVACAACSRHDTQLRRALLVARNGRTVELSPEFRRKLAARLAAERIAGSRFFTPSPLAPRLIAAAALLLIAAGGGMTALMERRATPAPELAMAPVVVVPPALPAEPVAAPAMFATISSSLPVYPAVLLAQRAAEQFAATHERTVSFQASH